MWARRGLTIDGEFVVDMWGGWVDASVCALGRGHDHQRVVDDQDDGSIAALMAVDRGLLDVDAPVREVLA